MQSAQRVFLIAAAVFSVILCCFYVSKNNADKIIVQWEKIKVEEFLLQIKRNQGFSMNEYILFINSMKYTDERVTCNLDVYQKEWDMKEQEYYCLILQDEIKKILEQENRVELKEGSIVKIVVQHKTQRNVYYSIVHGKDER